MDSILYELTTELKKELEKSKEYKILLKKEKQMEEDEQFQKLAYKKSLLEMEYEDNLKIYSNKNNPILLKNKKEIAEILRKINSLEVVKEYNKAYKDYQNILNYINKEIFDLVKDENK